MLQAVRAELSRDKQTIQVRSPFSPTAAEEAKSVPGAEWNPGSMEWEYPATLDAYRALKRTYGVRFRGSKRLNWEMSKLKRRMQERAGVARRDGDDVDLPVLQLLFPHIVDAMNARPYQKTGAKFIAEVRNVGIFDEVGLGKTVVSIAGTIEAGCWEGPHLVLATKTALESVWAYELRKWTNGAAEVFVAPEGYANRKQVLADFAASKHPSKWLVINPAMLAIKKEKWCAKCRKWAADLTKDADPQHWIEAHKPVGKVHTHKFPELQATAWRSIIADEAHKYMSTAIKSKSSLTQEAEGLMKLQSTPDGLRLALTGTPMRGKELNLWGIMRWLNPGLFRSKWDWVDLYFDSTDTFFGKQIGGLRPELEPDFWAMLDSYTLRRTKAEVRPGIKQSNPPTVTWVPLTGTHRKQYETFSLLGELKLPGGTMRPMAYISERTRLRQLAWGAWTFPQSGKLQPTVKSPKLDRLLDLLEERGIGEKLDERRNPLHYKFAVASQFTEVLDLLEEHLRKLGVPTMKITGDTPVKKRGEYAHSFQHDPDGPRVILLNTYAAGESLTLDRYCDTMFVLDMTDVWDDQAQLHGRIDNRSVTEEESVPRNFVYLLTRDTIDVEITEKSVLQHEMQHRTLDARRGVALRTTQR